MSFNRPFECLTVNCTSVGFYSVGVWWPTRKQSLVATLVTKHLECSISSVCILFN